MLFVGGHPDFPGAPSLAVMSGGLFPAAQIYYVSTQRQRVREQWLLHPVVHIHNIQHAVATGAT
jgi:hypothetical protein